MTQRQIKFRAWNGEEIEFFDLPNLYWRGENTGDYDFPDENVKVMQFTDLLDKNGKEIYEGDIVNNCGRLLVVEWNSNNACFEPRLPGTNWTLFLKYIHENCEVIGNIYQNPEFLKNYSNSY